MNGILAQAAALAAHAKASRVDARAGGDAQYWKHHSTFKYVKSVNFGVRRRRLFRTAFETVATEPSEWIARFPDVSADTVNLVAIPSSGTLAPHIAAAFAGAADHGIWVVGRDLWVGAWAPTHRDDPDQRIWSVTYTSVEPTVLTSTGWDLGDAREELAVALREVGDFAGSDSALSSWYPTFQEAERDLDRGDARAPYHPDILPERGYQLRARQLLSGAVRSWVFGGMGSWNDVWVANPDARARYARVTQRLYAAVTGALAAAVNRGLE